MPLTRSDFLNRRNVLATVIGKVTVPALGGDVHIAKLSAAGRDRLTAAMINLGKPDSCYHATVALVACCDDAGKKLFTEADLKWLAELDAELLEPVVEEANRLYRIGKEEADKVKNSSTGQTDDSVTA